MITPRLARQLKYSGFPQDVTVGAKVVVEPHARAGSTRPEDFVKVPTLADLITACGRNLTSIEQTDKGFTAHGLKDGKKIQSTAVDAEEAVAGLWIKVCAKATVLEPEIRNLLLRIMEETKLAHAGTPDNTILADKNLFKGYNMAVIQQEKILQNVIKKYLCI
jgi:hypothetical protein